MNYYFTPNKNLKEELTYLCDVSLFLSDEVDNKYIVDNYLETYFDVMKIIDNNTKNIIRDLLIADTHYYPTVRNDGIVTWIIEPGKFVPLVNEINTHCKNKLSIKTIDTHLEERNPQIEFVRKYYGAFPTETYIQPKIENTVGLTGPISVVVPGDDNTKNQVLDVDDINIELPAPALVNPINNENNTHFVPHKTNMLGRLKNWVLQKRSIKVKKPYGGNSKKNKSRKTKSKKSKKSRKQRKMKSKSRI